MTDMASETISRKREHQSTNDHAQSEVASWFKNRVFRGQNKEFAEIVEVTPEIAALFLKGNESNRAISKTNMERLVSEIENGRWQLNGETIIISKDGKMNDGQHRCEAVIATGRTIRTMVMFGATRDSRLTTDQGIVRTVGDMASMVGVENGNAVATTAAYIFCYEQSGVITTSRSGSDAKRRPTRTQVLELIETYPEIAGVVKRTRYGSPGGRSLCAFVRWAIEHRAGKSGQNAVDWFFERLASGSDLESGHPILLARNVLVQTDARLVVNEKAYILFVAWNSFRSGDKGKKYIKWAKGTRSPLPDLRK